MGLKRDLLILSAMIIMLISFTFAWSINESLMTYSSAETIDVGEQTAVTVDLTPFIAQGNNQIALTVTLQNSAATSKTVTMYIYPLDENGDWISGCTPTYVTESSITITAGGTAVYSYTFTKTDLRFEINSFQIILDDTTSGILQSVTFNEEGTANAPKAMVAYSNTTAYPDYRMYELSWSAERRVSTTSTGGTSIVETRGEYDPVSIMRDTAVIVTLNTGGYIDGYTYDGSSWTKTKLGRIGTSVTTGTRPFDVAYENSTGRAVVVWNNKGSGTTNGTKDLAYRIWNGRTWSDEYYIDDTSSSSIRTYYWVQLQAKMVAGSTEIALVGLNTARYANAWIWDGSSWSTMKALNDSSNLVTSASYEGCAVAWEYTSGDLIALSSSGANVRYYQYSGGSWSSVANYAMGSGNIRYMTLKSHKVTSSNRMMLLTLDSSSDAYARSWDGSSWSSATALDTGMNTNTRRCLDGDWEPTGTKFIAVGGNNNAGLSYKIWTTSGWSPSSTGSWSTFSGLTAKQDWIQVRTNLKAADPQVLIGTIDGNSDLVITTWTGSAMANQIYATTGTLRTFEAFDIIPSLP